MARKPKTQNLKKRSAFVLMVGDDGAILVQLQGKRVIRRLFAPSPEPQHLTAFHEALSGSPRSGITMLVDLTDQSYVRQTLPPVSSLSVGKIIKRRMEKDFPPEDINGYRMMGREKNGRKDWAYLMVSLANSQLMQKWIAFAVERHNPFKGLGVVPLEAEPMLLAMDKALRKAKSKTMPKSKGKEVKALEWQMLISHHKVGGFRQIVLRNGKLVFTRMAQMVGEPLPEVIAGNIEQELLNTLEYLKRMGLQDLSNLSVSIIASSEINQALDQKATRAGEYHFFAPHQVAELLALPDAAQPEDHFGDVVMSAFVAKRGKLLLPLNTPYTKKLKQLAGYLSITRITAALGVMALIGWLGMSGWDIYNAWDQTEKLESDQKSFQGQLTAIQAKANALPREIKTYTDIMTLSQLFDKRRTDPLTFLSLFAAALENAALVTDYTWNVADPLAVTKAADKRTARAEINLRLTLPHEPTTAYIGGAAALMDRIQHSFRDYTFTHSELPALLADTKDFQTTIDDSGNHIATAATTTQIETVKVTLEGPKPQDKHGH